ncbi:hypothetical protein [Haematomicrobium sanguinis]|uniref:hypothetical protein n=1 Tax=Haematomicrobium sanguinis TaxID=479106 RepID=UPI00047D50C8|nr:hypothetical protein [Haematomicrobium sanguinis]
MNEFNYPAPPPDQIPGEKDERAKAARYCDEAATLYRTHLQSVEHAAEALEPFTESWLDFETRYAGSFEGRLAFVEHVAHELGWFQTIHTMTTHMGIPLAAVRLDHAAIYDYLSRYFHIFDTPEGMLHVFTRDGIKPMTADISWKGGRL